MIHGVATAPELAYRRHLEELARAGAIVYVPAISRPADPANDGWHGRTGRLDSIVDSIAAEAGLDPAATVAYLCGNPAMIAAVEPRLAAIGIPAECHSCRAVLDAAGRRFAADRADTPRTAPVTRRRAAALARSVVPVRFWAKRPVSPATQPLRDSAR